MAVETKYVCDRCGYASESFRDPVAMFKVKVTVDYFDNKTGYPDLEALWCEKCVAEAGFIKRPELVEPPAVKITIEDLVAEICAQVVGESK